MKSIEPITCRVLGYLLLAVALTGSSLSASAQNKNESDSVLIEVKDGIVYVDGKEVSRLENKDAPVRFRSGNGDVSTSYFFKDDADRMAMFKDRNSMVNAFDLHGNRLTSGDAFLLENSGVLASRLSDLADMAEVSRFNPQIAQKESEARDLAYRIRRESGDTSRMEAELDKLLGEIFDEKLSAQQKRVDTMRENLTELEEQMVQRKSDRQQIIDVRKQELIGERSRFDW